MISVEQLAAHSGETPERLADPLLRERAVEELWLQGRLPAPSVQVPASVEEDTVRFGGLVWRRGLVSLRELASRPAWSHRTDDDDLGPALGVSFEQARSWALAAGGRLPSLAEWAAATRIGGPGNCDLRVGGPTRAGAFPVCWTGLHDGWGNAWEWVAEGIAVGGASHRPPALGRATMLGWLAFALSSRLRCRHAGLPDSQR